jgi:hypothetical protein
MSFTFDPNNMIADLQALSRGASVFFAPQSSMRVSRLASNLRNAVASAKAGGSASFGWRTENELPVQILESKGWKGGTGTFDAMTADVELNYNCRFLPAHSRVQATGVCVITIRDVPGDGKKVVHFDVEDGGWSEIRDGVLSDRAGHPPFHAQFHGLVNDIPRMPSLIVHPIDVINFAILELHQKRWREHVTTFKARSELREFPQRQRARLAAILECWTGVIGNPDFHALVAMQRPFLVPLSL